MLDKCNVDKLSLLYNGLCGQVPARLFYLPAVVEKGGLYVEERVGVEMSGNETPCCHQREHNIRQKNSDRHASGCLHHSVHEKCLGAKTVQTRNNAKLLFISVVPH